MTGPGGNGPRSAPGGLRPKRFYQAVTVAEAAPLSTPQAAPPTRPQPRPRHGDAIGAATGGLRPATGPAGRSFRVLLDGKPLRTPAKRDVVLPSRTLAEAIAAEWAGQAERIDPATMPLARLAHAVIDGVAGREAEVRADIVKYAGSDLLCYRAEGPQELVRRQALAWDPVLAWAKEVLGARFEVAAGIMPVDQPGTGPAAVAAALVPLDAFTLAAVHVMTTLTGSALLALGHVHGRLSAQEVWTAAHVDEDWQISQWGEDAEAKARRQRGWGEMQAVSRLLTLLSAD